MTHRNETWPVVLQGVAALWLIVSPWLLGFTDHTDAMMNVIVMGLIIEIAALIHYFTIRKNKSR